MIVKRIVKRWVRGGSAGNVTVTGALAAVLAGVLAGALAGCATPPAPRAAPGPTRVPVAPAAEQSSTAPARQQPTQAACPEGGVRLTEGGGDAAMGLRVESIRVVNCGAEPYVLDGYPEMRLLDEEQAPMDVTVAHGSAGITSSLPSADEPPERVTLAPGEAASMTLVWRNRVTDGTAAEGWVLDVSPRPGAPRLTLRLTRPVDLGDTGKLGIGPWRAAAH
ncbi:DUF4232 domain-containing protein [Streptomyces sp. NPDC003038]|uniref:DUF4232 domain-containing protein n=1 Tax=unclassified Streptomyces TaxID=2593676 RepID=UPI0033BF396C